MRNDDGGVIVGYFTKIALVLSLFSIICFDAVSVGVAKMNAEDTARGAAFAGAEAWNTERNLDVAYAAAQGYAVDHGGSIDRKSFTVAEDGTVTVSMTREATTLLLYRTKKSAKWAVVTASASGRAV